jgi:hypothetical protein
MHATYCAPLIFLGLFLDDEGELWTPERKTSCCKISLEESEKERERERERDQKKKKERHQIC